MRAVRVCALFVVTLLTQTGVSFASADWLDRLSGPGPFWGIAIGYRFLCISNSQDQVDFRQTAAGTNEPAEPIFTWLKPFERGSGLLPLIRPDVQSPTPSSTTYREEVAKLNCMADRDVRSYFTVTPGWYWSKENSLLPIDPNNPNDPNKDINQVHILRLTLQYGVRVAPWLDLATGFGYARFSGKAFNTFSRPFATLINVEVAPFTALGSRGRYLKFGFSTHWFGRFDEQDFCKGTICDRIVDFESRREIVPRIAVIIDPSLIWRR